MYRITCIHQNVYIRMYTLPCSHQNVSCTHQNVYTTVYTLECIHYRVHTRMQTLPCTHQNVYTTVYTLECIYYHECVHLGCSDWYPVIDEAYVTRIAIASMTRHYRLHSLIDQSLIGLYRHTVSTNWMSGGLYMMLMYDVLIEGSRTIGSRTLDNTAEMCSELIE